MANNRLNFVEGRYYRTNEEIQALKLRVIHTGVGQLGVLSREEALAKAKELDLDLVEVAPNAKPPVVKIIDFAKFKYEESKKRKHSKASSPTTKQIRMRPFMEKHDFEVKLKKITKFLASGDRVRIQVRFFGREITKKEFGFDLITRVMEALGEKASLNGEPKIKGRALEALIMPDGPSKQKTDKNEVSEIKNEVSEIKI